MTIPRSVARSKLRALLAIVTGCVGACGVLFVASSATAQVANVHWDASAQLGVDKRFVVDRPAGVGDASIGPSGRLAAHVALLPLVRTGAYASYDLSPSAGATRDVVAGGLRVKVLSPWPHGAMRVWLFVGFGYAAVFARGYTGDVASASGVLVPDARVSAANGHLFELPFGMGVSYKLRKPWHLSAELGARYGFGHGGAAYDDPGPSFVASGASGSALPGGVDRWGLGLTIGLLFDR